MNVRHAALRQATDKVASIVRKAMNAFNRKLEDKKAVLSVNSKKREFRFSIEEKLNLDEVNATLSEAGIE